MSETEAGADERLLPLRDLVEDAADPDLRVDGLHFALQSSQLLLGVAHFKVYNAHRGKGLGWRGAKGQRGRERVEIERVERERESADRKSGERESGEIEWRERERESGERGWRCSS